MKDNLDLYTPDNNKIKEKVIDDEIIKSSQLDYYSPYSLSPLEFTEDGYLYSKYDHRVYELRNGHVVPKNYPSGYYMGSHGGVAILENGKLKDLLSPYSLSPLEFTEDGYLYSKYDHRVYELRNGHVVSVKNSELNEMFSMDDSEIEISNKGKTK